MTINTATVLPVWTTSWALSPRASAPTSCFWTTWRICNVTRVLIDGDIVAENDACTFDLAPFAYPAWVTHSMRFGRAITPETFRVAAPAGADEGDAVTVRVIEVLPGSVSRPRGSRRAHRNGRSPGKRPWPGRAEDLRVRAPSRDGHFRRRLRQGLRHQAGRHGLHRGPRRPQPARGGHERCGHGAGRQHAGPRWAAAWSWWPTARCWGS